MEPTTATAPPVAPPPDADACCPQLVTGDVLSAEDARDLAAVVKALADPVRLQLLSLVMAAAEGEVCACDLPAAVDRSQSTVSHHLSMLVDTGLLRREQRGRWAWFSVDRTTLASVATALSPA